MKRRGFKHVKLHATSRTQKKRKGDILRKIKNLESLVENGEASSRKILLQLMENVLAELDASCRIRELMSLEGDKLVVGHMTIDLSRKRNVYLLGAGKACNAMASAVCSVLGNRIAKGIISVKIAEPQDVYCNTNVFVGGHPIPNEDSFRAAKAMFALVDQAQSDDLFISVISGGSSALLSCPVAGVSPEEKKMTHDLMLRSGAKILEVNAVRRHLSQVNGGRLAERILKRGAQLINLIISDGVGALPTVDRSLPKRVMGTPMAPDGTTVQDARNAIVNYDLYEKLPKSVVGYLWDDARVTETPKKLSGDVTNFLLDSVPDSCETARKAADRMGIPSMILTTFLEGESKHVGMVFSSIAREIINNRRPIQRPCFVFASGETTTRVETKPDGTGGPSHELVLGFAQGIQGYDGVCMASIDTEGTDGTTLYAGGIADSKTCARLSDKQINVFEALRTHSSGDALEAIGDTIFTGNTGTNLCDFNVLYISE